METLAIPFTLSGGRAVVYPDTDDKFYAQILTTTLCIEPNEMPLDPNFGVNDPTFSNTSRANAVELAAKYIPEISIINVTTIIDDNGSEKLAISFTRED